MKKYILSIIAMAFGMLSANAQTISVADAPIKAGETKVVSINLDNTQTNIVSFQMDLTLPDGITLNKAGCELSSRFTDGNQELTIGKQQDGSYRLTSTSFALTPITGTSGEIVRLSLTAASDAKGGTASVKNIRLATSDSERLTPADASFMVNVSYTLTYKVDGNVYKTSSVVYGTAITPEVAPTKEGHTFSGWSQVPATMPNHDVVVAGTFTINSYTLTYKVDGEDYKTSTVVYGTALTPEAAPTKEGYTFSGWSEIPATMPANDVVVTGTFTINSYTLTYKVDGEVYKTSTVVYGTALTPEAAPTKEGYTFSGWSEIPETMPASDVVVTGSFTMNPATVTAKSYTIEYGDAIPTFEYDAEGPLFGTPVLSCTATSSSPVGTYQILVEKGTVSNNNVTYNAGTLTITPAPLSITANSYVINQGEMLPVFDATYEGFKNGETAEVLTKQPTFSCDASSGSMEGTYEIIVGGAEAENYTISYTNGTLTIIATDTDIAALNNVVYIENVEGFVGQQLTLSVKMKNTVAVQTVQFDLYLPDGVSVVKDDDGFDLIELSTQRTTARKMDSFSSNQISNGAYRVLINSNGGYSFDGEDGEIALVTVNISPDMEAGDYSIILKDIVLVNTSSEGFETEYVKSTLTVSDYSPGDVNGDSKVNAIDLNAIVNYILERRSFPFTFVEKAADLNNDSKVNAIDVNTVTNMILRGTTPQNGKVPAPIHVGVMGNYKQEK